MSARRPRQTDPASWEIDRFGGALMQKRFFGLLFSAMLVAAACGGTTASGSPGASVPAAAGGTTPSGAATGDDTFRFVVDSEPTTLATEPDDLPTAWITGFIYSSLYVPNYKLEYQPLLAAAPPDISADGLTWTVKLKDGVKFHDG